MFKSPHSDQIDPEPFMAPGLCLSKMFFRQTKTRCGGIIRSLRSLDAKRGAFSPSGTWPLASPPFSHFFPLLIVRPFLGGTPQGSAAQSVQLWPIMRFCVVSSPSKPETIPPSPPGQEHTTNQSRCSKYPPADAACRPPFPGCGPQFSQQIREEFLG